MIIYDHFERVKSNFNYFLYMLLFVMASKNSKEQRLETIVSNDVLKIASWFGIGLVIIANLSITDGNYTTYLASSIAYIYVLAYAYGYFSNKSIFVAVTWLFLLSNILKVSSDPYILIDLGFWAIAFLSQVQKQQPSK